MDGDIAQLPALCDLAEKYNCIMMVDDAHASGVLGNAAAAPIDHLGCHGRVDIQVGTLSKAIGSHRRLRLRLARPDRISLPSRAAIPFFHLASALGDGHVPGRFDAARFRRRRRLIKKLWANTKFFKRKLKKLGFNTGKSETPITPIMVGEAAKAFRIFAGAIR